jgi:hypothetical protein
MMAESDRAIIFGDAAKAVEHESRGGGGRGAVDLPGDFNDDVDIGIENEPFDEDRWLSLQFLDEWMSPAQWKRVEHAVLAVAWMSLGLVTWRNVPPVDRWNGVVVLGLLCVLLLLLAGASALQVADGEPTWGISFVLLYVFALQVGATNMPGLSAFFVASVVGFGTFLWFLLKEARLRYRRLHSHRQRTSQGCAAAATLSGSTRPSRLGVSFDDQALADMVVDDDAKGDYDDDAAAVYTDTTKGYDSDEVAVRYPNNL